MAHKNKQRKDSFFNLYFTTTISIALALLAMSFTVYLLLLTHKVTEDTRESLAVSVVLKDSIPEVKQQRLEKYLNDAPFIKQALYVSKEQALAEHVAALGDDPTELLLYNPIQASYEIYLHGDYISPDSVKWIAAKIMDFEGVSDVVFEQEMLQSVTQNLRRLSLLLMVVSIVLLIISIVLINNTIRISVYSKRFIINTMKLVGAKSWFIRGPFVRRYLLNGLLAAILALAFLAGILYYLQGELNESINLFQMELIVPVAVVTVALALLITFFASLFGVNKYLRMKTDDLYYI